MSYDMQQIEARFRAAVNMTAAELAAGLRRLLRRRGGG